MKNFRRKLEPLHEIGQENLFNQIDTLAKSIGELRGDIKKLSEHGRNPSDQEIEDRFRNIEMEIPSIQDPQTKVGKKAIQRWLGELCRRVFSAGFNMMEKGKLTEKKAKVFCCENILFNVIELVRKNELKQKEVELINEWLRGDQIGYSLLKYPQSEESEVSLGFENLLYEVDNFSNNSNDLIYKSKVQFEFREDGNYNS